MKCKKCGKVFKKERGEFYTSIKTGVIGFCSESCLLRWAKENKITKLTYGSFSGGDFKKK